MRRNSKHQRILSLLLSFALVCGIFGVDTTAAWAAGNGGSTPGSPGAVQTTTGAAVSLAAGPRTLSLDDGSIVIRDGGYTVGGDDPVSYSGGYLITQSAGAKTNTVSVETTTAAAVDITIQNVNIDVSGTDNDCAFSIAAGAAVNLTLDGTSTLKSGNNCAGLQVPGDGNNPPVPSHNASLTVTARSTGTLTAVGGENSAGIGGNFDSMNCSGKPAGMITVNGGTVTANGAGGGAGIGGSDGGGGGSIAINSGLIVATGGDFAAGVGGGENGGSGSVAINGGIVTATGGNNAAGIGGGEDGEGDSVTINGGTITATGGSGGGAGIGGGSGGYGGKITVKGGSVRAAGGSGPNGSHGGAGIGGGTGGSGGHVKISGSSTQVTAEGNGSFDIGSGDGYATGESLSVSDGATVAMVNSDSNLNTNVNSPSYQDCQIIIGNTATIYKAGQASATQPVLYLDGGSIAIDGSTAAQGNSTTALNPPTNDLWILQRNSGTATQNTISVQGGTHDITIWNANIDVSGTDNDCAFSIAQGAAVNLTLEGTNTLKSGSDRAGLEVPGDAGNPQNNASLNVTAQSSGTLTTVGGYYGAGIGGGFDSVNSIGTPAGIISVNGGTVTASGGQKGAGIGGGCTAEGGTIQISGSSTVTATGGNGAAGIGGGSGGNIGGAGGNITIIGGTVTATGNYGGAGIGGGWGAQGGAGGNITISGGSTVTATGSPSTPTSSDSGSAGIGGGAGVTGGEGGAVAITGAGTHVSAKGQSGGWDIGSGSGNSDGGSLTVGDSSGTSLPTLEFLAAGTNASNPQFKNCIITGAGAKDAAGNTISGSYGANGKKIVPTPTPTPAPTSTPISGGFSAPSLPSSVTDAPTSLQADLSGASFPVGVTVVSLAATPSWPSSATDPQTAVASQVMLANITPGTIGSPFLYNIKLLDQNGNPVTFTGSVTVRLPIPKGLRGTPHVFRFEPDTKKFTDMNAKVENGFLVFSTTHFSYYAVAGMGNAITLDTLKYQMPVGGHYQIGIKLSGTKAASVKIGSTNGKAASAVRLKNGNYLVTGKGTGTAYITFDVYDSKKKFLTHASVRVDVKTGIRPRGDSTRQVGMF